MRQRRFSAVVTLALVITLAVSLTPLGPKANAEVPGWDPHNAPDYYPEKAKRQGITGRVGLECSVDEKGRARNIVVLESGGPILDDGAKKMFAQLRFKLPPGWSASGGPAQRLRCGVIFLLVGKPDVARFEDDRKTVIVTADPRVKVPSVFPSYVR